MPVFLIENYQVRIGQEFRFKQFNTNARISDISLIRHEITYRYADIPNHPEHVRTMTIGYFRKMVMLGEFIVKGYTKTVINPEEVHTGMKYRYCTHDNSTPEWEIARVSDTRKTVWVRVVGSHQEGMRTNMKTFVNLVNQGHCEVVCELHPAKSREEIAPVTKPDATSKLGKLTVPEVGMQVHILGSGRTLLILGWQDNNLHTMPLETPIPDKNFQEMIHITQRELFEQFIREGEMELSWPIVKYLGHEVYDKAMPTYKYLVVQVDAFNVLLMGLQGDHIGTSWRKMSIAQFERDWESESQDRFDHKIAAVGAISKSDDTVFEVVEKVFLKAGDLFYFARPSNPQDQWDYAWRACVLREIHRAHLVFAQHGPGSKFEKMDYFEFRELYRRGIISLKTKYGYARHADFKVAKSLGNLKYAVPALHTEPADRYEQMRKEHSADGLQLASGQVLTKGDGFDYYRVTQLNDHKEWRRATVTRITTDTIFFVDDEHQQVQGAESSMKHDDFRQAIKQNHIQLRLLHDLNKFSERIVAGANYGVKVDQHFYNTQHKQTFKITEVNENMVYVISCDKPLESWRPMTVEMFEDHIRKNIFMYSEPVKLVADSTKVEEKRQRLELDTDRFLYEGDNFWVLQKSEGLPSTWLKHVCKKFSGSSVLFTIPSRNTDGHYYQGKLQELFKKGELSLMPMFSGMPGAEPQYRPKDISRLPRPVAQVIVGAVPANSVSASFISPTDRVGIVNETGILIGILAHDEVNDVKTWKPCFFNTGPDDEQVLHEKYNSVEDARVTLEDFSYRLVKLNNQHLWVMSSPPIQDSSGSLS